MRAYRRARSAEYAWYGENMKKRNRILTILLAVGIAALLCVSLVACNIDGNDGNDGSNEPNEYQTPKYTVTFNTNGGTSFANSVVKNIPSGTRVAEPTDANGQKIIPIKIGYTFKYWSHNGSTAFDFTEGIKENITLTAIYEPNKYRHTPHLNAKLVYDATSETFSVDEDAREVNDVTLPAAELSETTTTLYSTYNSSDNNMACASASDSAIGKFCFWYYIDDEGKPVQLTKWKSDEDSTVKPLASYKLTKSLDIYPMFTDNLPKVTVKYADSLSGAVYNRFEAEYVFGENIPADSNRVPDAKNGYSFDYWYYIVKDKDDDGNEVKENVIFVFDDGKEKNPTAPMDAAQSIDNFAPVDLTLYAKWTREIKVTSLDEFKALYNETRTLLGKEEPTDEEKKSIEYLLSANISFDGDINLGEEKFEPLFDKDHPFTGTIDGATYGDNNSVQRTAKLTGGVFGNSTNASVFGYNQGTIKNIVFENTLFDIDNAGDGVVYIGTITTDNAGTITDCAVVYTNGLDIAGARSVVFGGITAVNRGTSSNNGIIKLCTVNIAGFTAECESLTFGGVAGESTASATVSKVTVSVDVFDVRCADDGNPSNGRSYLTMGGIVGINGSVIRLSTVTKFEIKNATSLTEFVFGGVAGVSTGNIRVVNANVTLGSKDAPVNAGGSRSQTVAVGGMVGKNEGYAINSYCTANLYVRIASAPQNGSIVSVGGIMGSNYSDKKDSSTSTESGICAINYCYSLGEIAVTVADGVDNVSVYAGGIAGRNTHKKLGSLFSTVNVTVVNEGGDNNVGRIVGKMLNDVATNGNIFFIEEADLTVNGTKLGADTELEGTSVTVIGNITEEANFRSGKWVVGADGGTSVIGFNGQTWEVVQSGEDAEGHPVYGYPTFKADVYNEQ